MSVRGAQIEGLIDSLNPVTVDDPPAQWRPAVDALLAALAQAENIEKPMRLVGPTIALFAFLVIEGANLTLNAWTLATLVGTGLAAVMLMRSPEFKALTGVVSTLATAALHFMHDLSGYIVAGMLINIAISYALERLYPALLHRDRIVALGRHFLPPKSEPIDDVA